MSAVWDFLLSPMGLAVYAGFWLFKLTVGVWLVTRLVAFLPVRAQVWAESKLVRLKLMKRKTGPLV
jgi:hypothetical protein